MAPARRTSTMLKIFLSEPARICCARNSAASTEPSAYISRPHTLCVKLKKVDLSGDSRLRGASTRWSFALLRGGFNVNRGVVRAPDRFEHNNRLGTSCGRAGGQHEDSQGIVSTLQKHDSALLLKRGGQGSSRALIFAGNEIELYSSSSNMQSSCACTCRCGRRGRRCWPPGHPSCPAAASCRAPARSGPAPGVNIRIIRCFNWTCSLRTVDLGLSGPLSLRCTELSATSDAQLRLVPH